MRIDILTIFPEFFAGPLAASLLGKARDATLLEIEAHDLRAWADNKHRSVDDYPFGGGAGMVMMPGPLVSAIEAMRSRGPSDAAAGAVAPSPSDASAPAGSHVIMMTPAGRRMTQADALRLAHLPHLVFVCGRYEGIDARVVEHVDEELSIGDYVLSGGEPAALVVIDAVARLLPGVLGNAASVVEESFGQGGLLEYPQYTRPRSFRGQDVPEVLLSGDHAAIARWRREQALSRTAERRPDLLGATQRPLAAPPTTASASGAVVAATEPHSAALDAA